MSGSRTEIDVPIERIFLQHNNPRHEPYDTQGEIIEYLCRHENVPQLARDIVDHGLNPLERFAVLRDEGSGRGKKATYTVGEGNRRVCALKLLADPDLAPPDFRKSFEKLAAEWSGLEMVPAVVFEDTEDLDLWLDRIHQGPQGGVGRKDWNADQKQRHSGSNKNRIALAILDYAEKNGYISAEGRKGKLTTVQRYAGNAVFKETLGVDSSKPDEVCRNRKSEDFDLLIAQFIADLLNQPEVVNSRSNRPEIERYARELGSIQGQSRERIPPESITVKVGGRSGRRRRARPGKPAGPKHLLYDHETFAQLKALGSYKLQQLYHSLASVELQKHTPLLTVGVWSFLESLTARAGRRDTSFESFFSGDRLARYGCGSGRDTKALREAVARLAAHGNTMKHHHTAAAFNGDQLANDWETVKDLIIKCAEEAISKGS